MKKFQKPTLKRAAGFWLFLIAAVLAVAGSLVYYYYYHDVSLLRYYSKEAFIVPLIGVAVGLVLSIPKTTSKWASLVLYVFEIYAFWKLINGTYLYLSSAFYGGVTQESIASLNIGFLIAAVAHVLVIVLSIIATFIKSAKAPKAIAETVAEEI